MEVDEDDTKFTDYDVEDISSDIEDLEI